MVITHQLLQHPHVLAFQPSSPRRKSKRAVPPSANLLLEPAVGWCWTDITASPDGAQPCKGSCGSTGESSHLASLKGKVMSQLLYGRSGNGHNLKLHSFFF